MANDKINVVLVGSMNGAVQLYLDVRQTEGVTRPGDDRAIGGYNLIAAEARSPSIAGTRFRRWSALRTRRSITFSSASMLTPEVTLESE